MKTLLILRHAKSSWTQTGLLDHDRSLNQRGKRDAPRMGELIKQQGLLPDRILSSTARRAYETAQIVAQYSGYDRKIQFIEDLYHAPPASYLKVLAKLPDELDCVMVIGHNPGLEELIEVLTGRCEVFPTAALAHVVLSIDTWHDTRNSNSGTLINVWRPRKLA